MPFPGIAEAGEGADFDGFSSAWMRERAPRARMRFERRAALRAGAPSSRREGNNDTLRRAERAAVVAAVSRVRARRRAAALPEDAAGEVE